MGLARAERIETRHSDKALNGITNVIYRTD
jgi:hypothetical protein